MDLLPSTSIATWMAFRPNRFIETTKPKAMYPRFSPPAPDRFNHAGQAQLATSSAVPATLQSERMNVRAEYDAQEPRAIIRLSLLTQLLSVSRSTVYLRLNPKSKYYDPNFPKPIRLGAKAVGWVLADVHAYIDRLRKCNAVN